MTVYDSLNSSAQCGKNSHKEGAIIRKVTKSRNVIMTKHKTMLCSWHKHCALFNPYCKTREKGELVKAKGQLQRDLKERLEFFYLEEAAQRDVYIFQNTKKIFYKYNEENAMFVHLILRTSSNVTGSDTESNQCTTSRSQEHQALAIHIQTPKGTAIPLPLQPTFRQYTLPICKMFQLLCMHNTKLPSGYRNTKYFAVGSSDAPLGNKSAFLLSSTFSS